MTGRLWDQVGIGPFKGLDPMDHEVHDHGVRGLRTVDADAAVEKDLKAQPRLVKQAHDNGHKGFEFQARVP